LGSGFKASTPLRLELFNLRGQKVSGLEHVGEVLNGATLSMPVPNIANGLYFLRIIQNNKTTYIKKICVLK
ncbi:MAG: T9SS type A sorting domain-containing protein, partial [Candidatus Cloacimonetes bacterium]|nr:T9SS type A sorting domain-containing protein [Candidatus Cloacimonadota bacterium]MCK9241739.1 T9SS type A sorting domain-containing protein [Candidatus Cloacimonadota bacterium]